MFVSTLSALEHAAHAERSLFTNEDDDEEEEVEEEVAFASRQAAYALSKRRAERCVERARDIMSQPIVIARLGSVVMMIMMMRRLLCVVCR